MGNWTDEELDLMVRKLIERKAKEADAMSGKHTVSAQELAMQSGGSIKYQKAEGS